MSSILNMVIDGIIITTLVAMAVVWRYARAAADAKREAAKVRRPTVSFAKRHRFWLAVNGYRVSVSSVDTETSDEVIVRRALQHRLQSAGSLGGANIIEETLKDVFEGTDEAILFFSTDLGIGKIRFKYETVDWLPFEFDALEDAPAMETIVLGGVSFDFNEERPEERPEEAPEAEAS